LPAVDADDVKIVIDKNHCTVKLNGKNIIIKFVSLFEKKLNQMIIDQITPVLKNMLADGITKMVNSKTMETNGFVTPFKTLEAFSHLTFDF
jgi:hypothetical protein